MCVMDMLRDMSQLDVPGRPRLLNIVLPFQHRIGHVEVVGALLWSAVLPSRGGMRLSALGLPLWL